MQIKYNDINNSEINLSKNYKLLSFDILVLSSNYRYSKLVLEIIEWNSKIVNKYTIDIKNLEEPLSYETIVIDYLKEYTWDFKDLDIKILWVLEEKNNEIKRKKIEKSEQRKSVGNTWWNLFDF